jgi:hypothetical protein
LPTPNLIPKHNKKPSHTKLRQKEQNSHSDLPMGEVISYEIRRLDPFSWVLQLLVAKSEITFFKMFVK